MANPQLTDVPGIGEVVAGHLRTAGIRTVTQLSRASPQRLESLPGFGPVRARSAKAAAAAMVAPAPAAAPAIAGMAKKKDKRKDKKTGKRRKKKGKKGKKK